MVNEGYFVQEISPCGVWWRFVKGKGYMTVAEYKEKVKNG